MKKTMLTFLAINFVFAGFAMAENLIEEVNCSRQTIRVVLNKKLKEQNYVVEDFFVEYNDDEVDCTMLDYSIVTMPVVMNLITLIWATGDIYHIDAMDEQLFYSLKTVKEIFRRLYPNTSWEGELKPRCLVNNSSSFLVPLKSDDHIAVLFSHGLDSICTALRYSEKKQLLLTARGHSDCPLGHDEVWEYLSNLVTSYAERFNHTTLFFSSNYHRFLNFKHINSTVSPEIASWRLDAIEGLCWIGLAAPIMISKGYSKLCIGSSYTWDIRYPHAALPMIDENINFAGIQVIHDAFELSREYKTEYIVQQCKALDISSLTLRVCSMIRKNEGKNCSHCEKCFRTITALLLLDEDLEKYGFSISKYEAMEIIKEYMPKVKMIDRGSCFWRSLQQFSKKKLKTINPEYQAFAEWLIQLDLDKLTIFRSVKKIDWNDYVDLYAKIPEYLLN